MQFSVTVRNARADVVESTIGASPVLKIRSGTAPATCATADSGTVLATMTLPSDWLTAASAGVKSKSGTWSDTSADATGTAGHYRIYDSTGTTCHWQGPVSAAGGGGDLIVDSVAFTAGLPFEITVAGLTEGNA